MKGVHRQRTALFNDLFKDWDQSTFAIQTADGWSWRSSERAPDCTLIVRSPKALRALLVNPTDLTLGEAFIDGDLDVEGDLFAAFSIAEHVFRKLDTLEGRVARALRSAVGFEKIDHILGIKPDQKTITAEWSGDRQSACEAIASGMVFEPAILRYESDDGVAAECRRLKVDFPPVIPPTTLFAPAA